MEERGRKREGKGKGGKGGGGGGGGGCTRREQLKGGERHNLRERRAQVPESLRS